MTKRILSLALVLASFAAVAPAAVVYGRGYGYRGGVYAAPRYSYGPRYYGGGYYRGGGYRGGYARGYRR
jgi:hypothetical protein